MLKKIVKNSFFLSASQLFSRTIGFVYLILLARYLSVENFGIYTLTVSFVFNFISVADFGIERLVLRDISRYPDHSNQYFSKLVPLRILLSLASIVLITVLALMFRLDITRVVYLAVFSLFLIPYNLIFLLISVENAKEKMVTMSIVNIALISIETLLGIIFIRSGMSLVWLFLTYLFANSLVLFFLISRIKKYQLSLKLSIDYKFWRKIISESWIFAVFTIISVFYLRATLLMIGILKGSQSTGIYGSVFKFVESSILISQSVSLAVFPLSSRLFHEDKNKLKNIYLKGLVTLFLLSLPVFSVIIFFSKQIVFLAFGERYLEAASFFPILGLSLILFFVNSLSGNIIQNSPKVKSYLPYAILILLFIYFISYFLIQRYSYFGAAWAVVAGETFGFIVSNLFVYKLLKND